MSLQTKSNDGTVFSNAVGRFHVVSAKFAEFHAGARADFANVTANSPIVEDLAADGRSFSVDLRVRRIHFKLVHLLNEDGSTIGRVYCSMEDPLQPQERLPLGNFTLRPNGMTDAVDADPSGEGELYASHSAYRIIGHVALLAIKRPPQQN